AVQRLVIAPELSMRLSQQAGESAQPQGELLPLRVARRDAADRFERDYVTDALRRASGNPVRAALLAEVSRQMIQKMMRKHGIEEG
ncbi:MAG: hypothetical protein ABW352_14465, partial [Polyangiales bacterium]